MNPKRELLLQKRSKTKEAHPGLWDISAAGHASAGDTSIKAAIRETEEELGLTLSENDFDYLFTVTQQVVLNNGTYINNEFNDVYLVKRDINQSELKLQKEEVSKIKFIAFEELEKIVKNDPANFVPHTEEYKKLFAELHKRYL